MRVISTDSDIQTIPWRKLTKAGTLVRFQGALALWYRIGIAAFDGRYWAQNTLDRLEAKIEVLPKGCSVTAVQE